MNRSSQKSRWNVQVEGRDGSSQAEGQERLKVYMSRPEPKVQADKVMLKVMTDRSGQMIEIDRSRWRSTHVNLDWKSTRAKVLIFIFISPITYLKKNNTFFMFKKSHNLSWPIKFLWTFWSCEFFQEKIFGL